MSDWDYGLQFEEERRADEDHEIAVAQVMSDRERELDEQRQRHV